MIDQTPPETMRIDERLDEIAGLMHLAIVRLKEKMRLAGYKSLYEYLAVREKERKRNPYL